LRTPFVGFGGGVGREGRVELVDELVKGVEVRRRDRG
jgi:hypothetical protein